MSSSAAPRHRHPRRLRPHARGRSSWASACGRWPVAALAAGLIAALAASPAARQPSQAPAPGSSTRIVKIAGDAHKLLLRADGTVAGWGTYISGQLGPVAAIPGANSRATALVAIALPAKAVDIAANADASYAVLDDGTVMAWGRADAGQLGNGQGQAPRLATSTQSSEYRGVETPTRIEGLSDVASVAADGTSAYAVLTDGTVRAWGGRNIGDGRAKSDYTGPPSTAGPAYRPVEVPGLTGVVAVSAGGGCVLALTKDGRVVSWGSNFYGALGRPPRVELALDNPGEIPGLTDVVQAVAGAGISTAVKKDGTVWVWGSNWQQQFGFPAPTVQPGPDRGFVLEPQQVPGLTTVTAVALGVNGRHTLALLKDGTLRVWGNQDWGQAGTGAGPGYHPRPLTPKIAGVAAVFAAGNNSFAVLRDGTLWAWGSGGAGQFPLTSNVRVPTPAPAGLR
ncbi:MAG: RCC1 domain-containing protein [Vicinamibacterales bacterium]